jgi:hypothetical protein
MTALKQWYEGEAILRRAEFVPYEPEDAPGDEADDAAA